MIPLFSVVSVFSFLSHGNLSSLIITAAKKQNSKTQKQRRRKKAGEEGEESRRRWRKHMPCLKGMVLRGREPEKAANCLCVCGERERELTCSAVSES